MLVSSRLYSAPHSILSQRPKTFQQHLNTETFDAVTDKVYFRKNVTTSAGPTHYCNTAQPLLGPSHNIAYMIAMPSWRSDTLVRLYIYTKGCQALDMRPSCVQLLYDSVRDSDCGALIVEQTFENDAVPLRYTVAVWPPTHA